MKLTNLEQTLLVCINYQEKKGNHTRAQQLRDKLEEVRKNKLEDEKTNNLYKYE
jgi:hypothetical protein